MRYPVSGAFAVSLILLPAAFALAPPSQQPSPSPVPPLQASTFPREFGQADEVFDLRVDRIESEKGTEAAFSFVGREMARTHKPHIAAVYAQYLSNTGGLWGLPAAQTSGGVAIALDALHGGSVRALSVLGWEMLEGRFVQQDVSRGTDYLWKGAAAGDPKAMRYYGTACLMERRLPTAEYWIRAAAYRGEPAGLLVLAAAHESGSITGTPDVATACRYYYLAYVYGYRDSRIHLQQLADKGAPGAVRYNSLVILWRATHGHFLLNDTVAQAASYLETSCPKDAEALDALGLLYQVGFRSGFMDFKKSQAFFERAIALGSLDARSHRAFAFAEGIGCRKDPAAALAEWRLLERQDNPSALADLGYYSFWGSLEGAGLRKDAYHAFDYSRRAADAGEPFGAANLAKCYLDGIGIAPNYGLAAEYFRVALQCHVLPDGYALKMIDRCLAFAK